MKKYNIIFAFLLFTLICFGQSSVNVQFGIQADLKPTTADTINVTDSSGKKQGYWVHYFKYDHYVCVDTTRKKQEGRYKDNIKTGLWTEYYCNGNIKSTMTFVDGRPEGPGKAFYEDGKILDEGVWKNKRWVSSNGSQTIYHNDTDFKFGPAQTKSDLASNWRLLTKTSSKSVFNEDTLKFRSCNNCAFDSPLVLKPSFVFERFMKENNEHWSGRHRKRFLFSFEIRRDSIDKGVQYIGNYYGKWHLKHSGENNLLVLKRIVTFADIETDIVTNPKIKGKLTYKIIKLDSNEMFLVLKK